MVNRGKKKRPFSLERRKERRKKKKGWGKGIYRGGKKGGVSFKKKGTGTGAKKKIGSRKP